MDMQRRMILGSGAATLLVACGGIDGGPAPQEREVPQGPGTGGTGGRMDGECDGWGSIFIAGVKLDDSATQFDLDGVSSIGLGMYAEVQTDGAPSSPKALSIRARPSLVGIALISGGQMSVNGVSFVLSSKTVWSTANGLADVVSGAWVSAHGFYDGTALHATRIDVLGSAPGATVLLGALSRGTVVKVGDQVVSWSGNPNTLPPHGTVVRATLAANSVSIEPLASDAANGTVVHRQGVFSGPSSQSFEIQGLRVVMQPGASLDTTAGPLVNGANVRAKGTMQQGILRATSLHVLGSASFRLEGTANQVTGSTLRVKQQDVALTASTQYINGSVQGLISGVSIRVVGSSLRAGVLRADSVEFV